MTSSLVAVPSRMNFELIVNFKAAESLDITLPPYLLLLADRRERDQENRCRRIW